MEIGVLRNDGIALLSKALGSDLELCLGLKFVQLVSGLAITHTKVILLGGSTKQRQQEAIETARERWADYRRRKDTKKT